MCDWDTVYTMTQWQRQPFTHCVKQSHSVCSVTLRLYVCSSCVCVFDSARFCSKIILAISQFANLESKPPCESADENSEQKREETKPTVLLKAAVDGTFREFVFTFRDFGAGSSRRRRSLPAALVGTPCTPKTSSTQHMLEHDSI